MKKILIFGAAGSGCSTLGEVLAGKLDFNFLDSDDYFWVKTDPPFQKSRHYDEARHLLKKDVDILDSWVLSGSQILAEIIKDHLDLVVFLYVPDVIRISRLKAREAGRFGDKIKPGGVMQKTHEEFIDWASKYGDPKTEARNIHMHEDWMKTLPCPIIRIEGSEGVAENLEKLLHHIRQSTG